MSAVFCKDIINKLQQRGADKSQVWLTSTTTHELNIERNEISFLRTVNNSRLNMKIIKDQKNGTTSLNDLSNQAVETAISELFTTMESSLPDPAHDIAPSDGRSQVFGHNLNNLTADLMVQKLQKLLVDARERYPKVIISESHMSYNHVEAFLANSNGADIKTEDNYFVLLLFYTAKDGKKTSSFNYNAHGYGALNPDQDLIDNEAVQRLLSQISEQTETHGINDKFNGDIIISPECMGQMSYMMLNPIFEHNITAKTSIYLDKLEQPIASPLLTIKSLPLSDEFAVKSFVSDDGFLNENISIVENGVLKTFLLSLYGANKSGFARSKSDGEMMVVESGNTPYAEMIKNCKRGVLLCRFSGGNPADNGDFSGVAKNSYYIENGEIKFPLSETMITGNTAEMLKNITAISQESVNNGFGRMPWVQISGLTISGGSVTEEKVPENSMSLI